MTTTHTNDCVRQRAKFSAVSLAGDVCSCGADEHKGDMMERREIEAKAIISDCSNWSDIHYRILPRVINLIEQRDRLAAALRLILTEAEYVGDAKAPFSTWVAVHCREALAAVERESKGG